MQQLPVLAVRASASTKKCRSVFAVILLCRHAIANSFLSRPEKSLHLLINNPVTSLHIFLNPEYRLHLFYRMKRKRALLRSNSPGIIQSDEHINPLLGLHLIMDLLFICTSAKPNKTYAIATSSFFCLLI